MESSSLALFRPNAFRAYVVFTPSSLFCVKYNEPKVHAQIEQMVALGNYQANFADRDLTRKSALQICDDEQLRFIRERDLILINEKFFGSVWLYGDSVSDYTLAVVNLSLQKRIKLRSFAQKGSLLERYVEQWVQRFGTLE